MVLVLVFFMHFGPYMSTEWQAEKEKFLTLLSQVHHAAEHRGVSINLSFLWPVHLTLPLHLCPPITGQPAAHHLGIPTEQVQPPVPSG